MPPTRPRRTIRPAPEAAAADTAKPSPTDELRRRLDEGARAVGITGAPAPMFPHSMGGMGSMGAMPHPPPGAPWMMPPPPQPATPSPHMPGAHGHDAAPMFPAMGAPGAGATGPAAGALAGVGNLVQTLVGILAVGIAGGRQLMDALNVGHGGQECGGGHSSCGCGTHHSQHACGCCGAAHCGAYPPYNGSCSMPSQRDCPSSMRAG